MEAENIRFSQLVTFGAQQDRNEGGTARILFENAGTGVRRTIVDDGGTICGFPGLAHPELVTLYSPDLPGDTVRFRSSIEKLDGRYALIWQIRPEGRYWEDDDGFGGTADEKVQLYARLDGAGRFMEPFRIYSVGSRQWYGTDLEEEAASALASKADPLSGLPARLPALMEKIRKMAQIPDTGAASCVIPGTAYRAQLALKTERGDWFVEASVAKLGSDTSRVSWLKFLPLEELRIYLSDGRGAADAEEKLKQLLYGIQKGN